MQTNDPDLLKLISVQEREILRSVRELKYGTVEVTVHDQFVVEVSKREKIRFQKQSARAE
ncbi:MAG: YezD family protein [Verrucomicrobiales bacterium]|nr:YezD family protein [Verrucomicrobiales bacterium]